MIYITGDTHNSGITRIFPENWALASDLSRDDIVIVVGDFGVIWNNIPSEKEEKFIARLDEMPYTFAFVDGNHENFDRINNYPEEKWMRGNIHRISNNVIHLMRGQIYDILCEGETKRVFVMGGAISVDRHQRHIGIDWWEQENPSYMEINEAFDNLDEVDNKVDYVLTHDCPAKVIPMIDPTYSIDSVEMLLEEIDNRIEYKKWFFGHHHLNAEYGVDKEYRMLLDDIVRIDS